MGGRDFCMRLYLCGRSALSMLRYLRGIRDDRLLEPPSRIRSLAKPLCHSAQIDAVTPATERLLMHAGDSIEVLVPSGEFRGGRGSVKARLWSGKLPAGAFLKLTDDLLISSPAFLFLQMARDLDPFELALLGLELCGLYSLPEKRTPFASGSIDEVEYEIPPVTTVKRIQSLCDAASGAPGAKRARMVSRWLADNAASPMESIVFLLLSLSRHWGGYGIPMPVFNPKVTIKTASSAVERFPDLYWEGASIDVEYQSDLSHTGNWKRYKDSKRQIQLTVNKITVLPLTKLQVENADDFHEFAMGLRKLLGLRCRGFDGIWSARRYELRSALFRQ